jgi:EmrB/QacA subfamily drug resistance transporter
VRATVHPGINVIRSLLLESPRPRRIREHRLAPWLVVATVSIGAFMGQLDASIVSLALPHIGAAFAAGPGVVVWVSLAYLLVLVCGLPVAGRFADRVGRKRLYVQGFVVFSVASAACGLAPDLPALIAARCLQGVGAALLQANSVALIREALSREQLGRGLGVQGAAQAVGLAGGPALGGLLLSLGGWRLLFLVNVPVGAVGIVAGVLLLPRSGVGRAMARFDWPGALLLALAAGTLMVLVSLGREPAFTAPLLAALVALAVAAAAGLVIVERRAPAPLLDLALLRRRPLAAALGSGFVAQTVLFGTLVAVPFDLAAHGIGSAAAGLELAALPVALAIAAPLAGRSADRHGAHVLTTAGIAITGLALAALAVAHGAPERVAALAAVGAGLGAFVPVNNATIMRAAASGHAGAMSGVLNMTRGLGTALGVALASLLYASAGGPGVAGADRGLMVALLALAALALVTAAVLAAVARSPEPPGAGV